LLINPLNTELNPICKSQLAELFCGVFKFCACFSKNLNISRTKQDKFVKQKAFCGEGNRHWSECLKNAISSLLLNGEDKFLNKFVNIHVLLLTLWSRLQLFARKTEEKMSYKLFFVSQRWAWLSIVLHVFRCVIFLLVAVQIHYCFSYFISREHTSLFHTWNIAVLHFQQNFSTANISDSNVFTEISLTSASYLVV